MRHHDEEGGDQGREDAAQDHQGYDPSFPRSVVATHFLKRLRYFLNFQLLLHRFL